MEHLPSHRDAHAVASRNPPTRHVRDVENNSPLTEPPPTHLGTSFVQRIRNFSRGLTTSVLPPDSTTPSPPTQTKECCFMCIDRNGRDTVAMQIPCPQIRPGQKERETEIMTESLPNYSCTTGYVDSCLSTAFELSKRSMYDEPRANPSHLGITY
jgi:hypothetical protein